eukprot:CAMPEP_0198463936 /NCGR_PEP_ID=MMETSP1456-20131121/2186_1 /TAXON_ID=1461544 ORGANISM="Unidentified sp., Strain RCC1871" /NCGR_SAMPLE_ID=MMETSP1456 /ASSEMBLY_ACC=CAM_ASM_001119 /LENGTH=60 /DNA_ID=CAMNT_0044189523 /DNA_START=121 /DNA_END=300 /DNA_ORIENTATION=+
MTHPFCNRFCSKGKVGPENVATSTFQVALYTPPEHKYPYPKGKADPDPLTISKLPVALPP